MKKKDNIVITLITYFLGLLIMTLGVSISVKSNLGVSPVSSIPYTMTCVWGIEMGKATIIFHVVLVAIQVLILRKNFKIKNLLQIPVGIIFGYFTTFCNYLMSFVDSPENIIIRLTMMLISTVIIAFGIFMYVPSDIMPLAGEGVMLAIADVTNKPFPNIKLMFDISMVVISLVTCICLIHSLGSVGIGTIIAAVLVGIELKFITKFFNAINNNVSVTD
ncbi:MAG: hypothetical protein E7214_01135 [Clostridium sp.]|nr:hypothetical protein [Clostridium sp.]